MKSMPVCDGRGDSTAKKMFLLASMYLCQAIPLGYVFGSLPVIMRESRMSLEGIGGLFILHLPWAFKFIYASWVDKTYFPALGRRRSWIFPLQWVGAGLLLVASQTPPETHYGAMYAVLMLLNIVMATNDIAVDGYATDILKPSERRWGNSVQAGARYVGMIFGGGLMLFLHSSMGWQFLCLTLAAVVFLLSLPVLLHREMKPVRAVSFGGIEKAGVVAFLRRKDILWLLPVLIAPTAFAFCGFQMRAPMFVDLGLDSKTIGRLLMHYGYPAGLAGTILSGWLLHRAGRDLFMRCFCLLSITLAVSSVYWAQQGGISLWMAAVALSMDSILMGGIQVWGFTLMMRACAGPNAGTGFAVLSSLYIIFPLAMAPFIGKLGDNSGFAFLYTLLAGCMVLGFFVAEASLRFSRNIVNRSVGPEAVVAGISKSKGGMLPVCEEVNNDN